MGYKRLHGLIRVYVGYKRLQTLKGVTGGYKGLEGIIPKLINYGKISARAGY